MQTMKENKNIVFLLDFFSRPSYPDWPNVPDLRSPRKLNIGMAESDTDQPLLVLAIILSSLLNGHNLMLEERTLDVLDEIRVLLMWYMVESVRDEIFQKRSQACDFDLIWRTLARLCIAALDDPAVKKIDISDVSLLGVIGEYTVD